METKVIKRAMFVWFTINYWNDRPI